MHPRTSLPNIGDANTIIYGCIVGSHAYGTNVEGSDIDKKWIYVQGTEDFYLNGYKAQIEISKDEVAYELSRFLELAQKANPTMLELLFAPIDCIIYKDPVFDLILKLRKEFLTKQCKFSFGGYAISQIEKARGLQKKMNWEKEKTVRKTVLDFCYWIHEAIDPRLNDHYQSVPIKTMFSESQIRRVGLAKVPNTRDLYNLFVDARYNFGGIVSNEETSNDIQLTEIPKDAQSLGLIFFNKDAYTIHCKEYREYQEWLKNRNTQRYVDIEGHGQMIDGKNLLHCIRLIETAIDMAQYGDLIVQRQNAQYLKDIRAGRVDLETILDHGSKGIEAMNIYFDRSTLPSKIEIPEMLKMTHATIRRRVEETKKNISDAIARMSEALAD